MVGKEVNEGLGGGEVVLVPRFCEEVEQVDESGWLFVMSEISAVAEAITLLYCLY